jgi:hypothetical protein
MMSFELPSIFNGLFCIGRNSVIALLCMTSSPAVSKSVETLPLTAPPGLEVLADMEIISRRFGGPVSGYSEDNEAFGKIDYHENHIDGIDALYSDGQVTVLSLNQDYADVSKTISFQCDGGAWHDGNLAKTVKVYADGTTRISWSGVKRQIFRDGQKINCKVYRSAGG